MSWRDPGTASAEPRRSLDHDELGSSRSKLLNVIDLEVLERDAGGKPESIFPRPARVPAACLTVLLLAASVSGCIRPLYAPINAGTGSVAADLQAIAIDPIPDRIGHYLGNELVFAFNGTGSKVQPRYRLSVVLRQSVQTPLLDTVSGHASAGDLLVNADYQLIPVEGGAPIAKGTATAVASFDRTSLRFSNIRAARDAEIRSARTLAEQIQTRIAAAFAAKG
jgi:LPS-assembly lipoprotein